MLNNGRPYGFYKNKTDVLAEYKQNIRQIQKKNRFQSDRLAKAFVHRNTFASVQKDQFALNKSNNDETQGKTIKNNEQQSYTAVSTQASISSDLLQEPLLKTDSKIGENNSITIELKQQLTLPPLWVDFYEECTAKLQEIEALQIELTQKGIERITRGFEDNSALDNIISRLTKQSNILIRECENKIKQIDIAAAKSEESASEAQVRKNVKSSLAQQISEATIRMRKQQKSIYDAMKKHSGFGGGGKSQIDPFMFQQEEEQKESSNEGQNLIQEEFLKDREKDIDQLVTQINELSDIYKTLSLLVIDQGTLLDRIDFNITQTKENVAKANKHLTSAVQTQESKFAQKVIQTLVGLIIFFSVLTVLKYAA